MTAEIAVMNKEAIALAADSAVTLREEQGQKIFTSTNKIFTLSKYQPVGAMIYGNASFMEVPWETIVKIYRGRLGKRKFDSLKEYADDFIGFLSGKSQFFPEPRQRDYVTATIYSYFRYMIEKIVSKVEEAFSEKDKITKKEVRGIVSQVVKEHYDIWDNAELLPSMPKNYIKVLTDKYGTIIDSAKEKIFQNLPMTRASSNQLTEIATGLLVKFPKGVSHSGISGFVIAGFGIRDAFPVLQSFLIEGVANDHLKHKADKAYEITVENNAAIIPFAQSEMVATFMEGIEPNYKMAIERDLSQIFEHYPEVIIDRIEKLDDDEKTELKKRLKEIGINMLDQYRERLANYRRKNYIDPVIKIVASLPKAELAPMAEALVNLTSLKRKMSMEAETVSEPIDVALISKGDGFIWIKRKHYFEAELNPQFFANYYRETENGEEE
jgi:hypothetical protein